MGRSCFTRINTPNHLGSVLDCLGGMECALLAGQALTDHLSVLVDEDLRSGRKTTANHTKKGMSGLLAFVYLVVVSSGAAYEEADVEIKSDVFIPDLPLADLQDLHLLLRDLTSAFDDETDSEPVAKKQRGLFTHEELAQLNVLYREKYLDKKPTRVEAMKINEEFIKRVNFRYPSAFISEWLGKIRRLARKKGKKLPKKPKIEMRLMSDSEEQLLEAEFSGFEGTLKKSIFEEFVERTGFSKSVDVARRWLSNKKSNAKRKAKMIAALQSRS